MVTLRIHGFSIYGNDVLSTNCSLNFSQSKISQGCYNLQTYFRFFFRTFNTDILLSIAAKKLFVKKCGTQTTKLDLARHKKILSAGKLLCTQYPNFSTRTQKNLKYPIAKKHSSPKNEVTSKCKSSYHEFLDFHALLKQKIPNLSFP